MASYQYIYVMQRLTKIFPGGKKVLENITLAFLPGAKIGVLGINGAGKSTLLRIIAGLDHDFSGEAWAAEGARVGFLPQEPELDPEKDVLGNVMEGVAATKALLDRFDEVSAQFGDPDADMDALMADQAELQERIDAVNGWELQRTVDSMLEGYTILGRDLRYLYVNAVAARQARLPKEQLIGRTPMELYPEFEQSGILYTTLKVHGVPESFGRLLPLHVMMFTGAASGRMAQ